MKTKPVGWFKRKCSILIIILIGLLLMLIMSRQEVDSVGLMLGGGLFIATIVLSAQEGYHGLIISVPLNLIGAAVSFSLYQQNLDNRHLIVGYFQISIAIACFALGWMSEKHDQTLRRMSEMSLKDFTTDVHNLHFFHDRLKGEFEKKAIYDGPLSVALVDIDNFRKINLRFGYSTGDSILKQSAVQISANLQPGDNICRYGGNSFGLILPNRTLHQALETANDIQQNFCLHNFFSGQYEEERIKLSVSVGVANYPETAADLSELIQQMDTALQQSKNCGRNRVEMYRDVFVDLYKQHVNDKDLVTALRTILSLINAKDHYTAGHSERVSDYLYCVGKSMGYTAEALYQLRIAALVHDIGKVDVSHELLNKKGRLQAAERREIQKHVQYGYEILKTIPGFADYLDAVLYHHERFDGTGYPEGRRGREIPFCARLLAVADAFDAMISDRPYRDGMAIEAVIKELEQNAGSQFDPEIVQLFIEAVLIKETIAN